MCTEFSPIQGGTTPPLPENRYRVDKILEAYEKSLICGKSLVTQLSQVLDASPDLRCQFDEECVYLESLMAYGIDALTNQHAHDNNTLREWARTFRTALRDEQYDVDGPLRHASADVPDSECNG